LSMLTVRCTVQVVSNDNHNVLVMTKPYDGDDDEVFILTDDLLHVHRFALVRQNNSF
jgi:TolB-like protein